MQGNFSHTKQVMKSHYQKVKSHYDHQNRHPSKRRKTTRNEIQNYHNNVKRSLIEQALGGSPSVMEVLDLCAGRGGDLLKFINSDSTQRLSLTLVDNSDTQIIEARRRITNIGGSSVPPSSPTDTSFLLSEKKTLVRTVVADSVEFISESGSDLYDICTVMFALNYLISNESDALQFFCNIHKILKPGAVCVFVFADGEQILYHTRKGKFIRASETESLTIIPPTKDQFGESYIFDLELGDRGKGIQSCPENILPITDIVNLLGRVGFTSITHQRFTDVCEFPEKYTPLQKLVSNLYTCVTVVK